MIEFDNIYNGDCLQLMPNIPPKSIDVCITDLPYGIDYQSNWSKYGKRFDKIANDKKPFIDFIQYLPMVMKDTGAIYLFTRWDVQQTIIDELNKYNIDVKNVLIWDKGNHSMGDLYGSYGNRYESIVFATMGNFRFHGKRPVDIIHIPRVPAAKLVHPNEKPVDLLRCLIIDSIPDINSVILDCTCGSGSTLVAAIKEKCHYIGFELDEHYFNIAKKRIKEEQRQLTLF